MTAKDYEQQFGERMQAHMETLSRLSRGCTDQLDEAAFVAACAWVWHRYSHGSPSVELVRMVGEVAAKVAAIDEPSH